MARCLRWSLRDWGLTIDIDIDIDIDCPRAEPAILASYLESIRTNWLTRDVDFTARRTDLEALTNGALWIHGLPAHPDEDLSRCARAEKEQIQA